jgi:hypothetical protein
VNLKYQREMGPNDISIGVVMAVAKLIDETLIGRGELRITQCEQAHRTRV